MLPEEFLAAQHLLKRAGALEIGPPTSIDVVLKYLADSGLGLHYYDPTNAPAILQETASGIDEAPVPQKSRSLLFINQNRRRPVFVLASFTAWATSVYPATANSTTFLGAASSTRLPTDATRSRLTGLLRL